MPGSAGRFPEWRGNIFVAALAGDKLARIVVDGQRFVSEEALLEKVFGRVRDVRQSPGGFIYLAFDSRTGEPSPVVRLEPVD